MVWLVRYSSLLKNMFDLSGAWEPRNTGCLVIWLILLF